MDEQAQLLQLDILVSLAPAPAMGTIRIAPTMPPQLEVDGHQLVLASSSLKLSCVRMRSGTLQKERCS